MYQSLEDYHQGVQTSHFFVSYTQVFDFWVYFNINNSKETYCAFS